MGKFDEILGRLEIPGHAHGIASMIHAVWAYCDCAREIGTMGHGQISGVTASLAVTGDAARAAKPEGGYNGERRLFGVGGA